MNKNLTQAVRLMTLSVAATLCYAAAQAASPAKAQAVSGGEALTYVVRYADLDLTRADGANVLYARLTHAARTVCRPFESREMGVAEKYRECMTKALTEAVANVNRPLLSQIHQSHSKTDKAGSIQLAKAN